MNAKDLRIGNIVHYKVEDELDDRKEWNEVDIIDAEDILSIEDYESKKQNHPYSPIPLTDEWMIRLGGRDRGGYSILTLDVSIYGEETRIVFELLNGMLTLYANDERVCFYKDPSVHQFQNLYFALTGEELKYQSTKLKV